MKNIMLDLETMATCSNAAIVAIGAVSFDASGIQDRFYETIKLETCLEKGMVVDGKTVMWWLSQSDEARLELRNNSKPVRDVLKRFQEWLGKGNIQIWGNGADFDNVILINAFSKFNAQPWAFYQNRCFRTIKNSFPRIDVIFDGVPHKAIDDAEHQARYLIKLIEKHKLVNML